MAYSNSTQSAYGPATSGYNIGYASYAKNKNQLIPTLAGAVVGGGVGAYLGYRGTPYMKKNGPKDKFSKNAYIEYANKVGGNEKTIYEQNKEILKDINKIKTSSELRVLMQEKKEAAKHALGRNYDAILNNLCDTNLDQNKKTLKNAVEAQEKNSIQKMKNWIQSCWNSNNKKLEKPSGIADDVFVSIQKAAKSYKLEKSGKYAAIGAVTTGLIAYLGHAYLKAQQTLQQ